MRNDPFLPPPTSLKRFEGHCAGASVGKLDAVFQPLQATGVPLSGIGTGGITRASDGRFSRWTLKAGAVAKFTMPANGFILRTCTPGGRPDAAALQPDPGTGELSAFRFEPAAPEWSGLFPVAWHRHRAVGGVVAECKSFSPVIAALPHKEDPTFQTAEIQPGFKLSLAAQLEAWGSGPRRKPCARRCITNSTNGAISSSRRRPPSTGRRCAAARC